MKTETFGTTQTVTRREFGIGRYLLRWQRPDNPAEAVVIQGEELSRQVAERIAGGESPVNVIVALHKSRAMSKAGKIGGAGRWANTTAEERKAHGRAAAAARWGKS